MSAALPRRSVIGAALAVAVARGPALALAAPLRGAAGDRLPDHAALWARLPLPFTPAEAWRLLATETQAEIGAAVIGMVLADYVSGNGHAEADLFLDHDLRNAAGDAACALLGGLHRRIDALFPDLYGPDGDHPAWALAAGMVHPLGADLPEPEAAPDCADDDEPDPVFAAIERARTAVRRDRATLAQFRDDAGADAEAACDAAAAARDAADAGLRAILPTTLPGLAALAEYHAADNAGTDCADALAHLAEATLALLAEGPPIG